MGGVQVLCTPPIFAPRSQTGTGVIIKMQGRKKQSYSEKDLSCSKKGMSVMKRKKRFGGDRV